MQLVTKIKPLWNKTVLEKGECETHKVQKRLSKQNWQMRTIVGNMTKHIMTLCHHSLSFGSRTPNKLHQTSKSNTCHLIAWHAQEQSQNLHHSDQLQFSNHSPLEIALQPLPEATVNKHKSCHSEEGSKQKSKQKQKNKVLMIVLASKRLLVTVSNYF